MALKARMCEAIEVLDNVGSIQHDSFSLSLFYFSRRHKITTVKKDQSDIQKFYA